MISVQSVSVEPDASCRAEDKRIRAIARRMPNGDTLVIGRDVDEAREISHVVGQALALGLLPALCLCLLAGAWLSIRAQQRVVGGEFSGSNASSPAICASAFRTAMSTSRFRS